MNLNELFDAPQQWEQTHSTEHRKEPKDVY